MERQVTEDDFNHGFKAIHDVEIQENTIKILEA